jgi:hypothetical protein
VEGWNKLDHEINDSLLLLVFLAGECDVTVGKWVHDPAGPLYPFDQCKVLSKAQNCQFNGRPDSEYEYYR